MHEIMRILWDMHPFEHLTAFLSSLIVVLSFISMIYTPTREKIISFFRDKKNIKTIEEDRQKVHDDISAMKNRMSVLEESSMTLLHDRLYSACIIALDRGYTNLSELENIEALYFSYHKLGGNGTGTKLYMRVTKLPVNKSFDED